MFTYGKTACLFTKVNIKKVPWGSPCKGGTAMWHFVRDVAAATLAAILADLAIRFING